MRGFRLLDAPPSPHGSLGFDLVLDPGRGTRTVARINKKPQLGRQPRVPHLTVLSTGSGSNINPQILKVDRET